jgi:acyl-CoA thioesterase-2
MDSVKVGQSAADDNPMEWDGANVADLFDLSQISASQFRSRSAEANEHGRIYGGQVLAQALWAASRTVPSGRLPSCLQLLFAAGGLPEEPVGYDVATLQEGKRFSARGVRGSQRKGRILCDANVAFATAMDSPAHETAPRPDCGIDRDPDDCPALSEIDAPGAQKVNEILTYSFRPHKTIDIRAPFVSDLLPERRGEPRMRYWIRLRRRLGDDPMLHAAAFAYLSDYWINFAACLPGVNALSETGARLYVASLNHAIWFHRPLRADEWLLFDCMSPSGAFGRGLAIARVFSRAGDVVASATQECLLAPTA